MSTCNEALKAQGLPYPRTCQKCGLGGACIGGYAAPTEPVPAYVVLWHYGDRSAFGVVSVHKTKAGADRMAGLLSVHADSKQFTVEPAPSES